MTIVIRSSHRSYISPNPLSSVDKYLHASANLLVFNPPTAPVIEIRQGSITLQLQEKVVFATTGKAEILADDKQMESWRTGTAQNSLTVKTSETAYLAIKGLVIPTSLPQPLKPGTTLITVNPNSVPDKILAALKVPQGLRAPNGDWLEAVSRLQRHLSLVSDAVQRGAELVKIRVSGGEFEAWVLELE
jgi:Allophanate hydrolase subunit 2